MGYASSPRGETVASLPPTAVNRVQQRDADCSRESQPTMLHARADRLDNTDAAQFVVPALVVRDGLAALRRDRDQIELRPVRPQLAHLRVPLGCDDFRRVPYRAVHVGTCRQVLIADRPDCVTAWQFGHGRQASGKWNRQTTEEMAVLLRGEAVLGERVGKIRQDAARFPRW